MSSSTAPLSKAGDGVTSPQKMLSGGEQVLPLEMLYKGVAHIPLTMFSTLFKVMTPQRADLLFVCRCMNMQM
jgi:hypothetical protein